MESPLRMEHPLLRIHTKKMTLDRWVALNTKSDGKFVQVIDSADIPVNLTELVDHVVLRNTLHYVSDRKQMIKDALEMVTPGGSVLAYAETCNSCEDLITKLFTAGYDVESYVKRLLTNKEIGQLRPMEAIFLKEFQSFNNRDVLNRMVKDRFPDVKQEVIDQIKLPFAMNVLHIGMIWKRLTP